VTYSDLSVGEFLAAVAAREPAPGGGAAAAMSVALAAALAAMAARFSPGMQDLAEHADALRAQALPLADADGAAFGRVLAAYRIPRYAPDRADRIAAALSDAADVPLAVAEIGAEGATLGARAFHDGNANLRGDALAAVRLAGAGTRTAAALVRLNLAADRAHRDDGPDDRNRRAEDAVKAVTAAEAATDAGLGDLAAH
jgi:formiminotetrahydrofolate cyclodeaminase